jgi:mRNA interferase MazF
MITEGQIILFKFPQTDQEIPGFDEMITVNDSDFTASGLKVQSLLRIGRLAVVNGDILLGKIGQIDNHRLNRLKQNLSQWILS